MTRASIPCPDCGGMAAPDDRQCAFCRRPLAQRRCPGCEARVLVISGSCPACGIEVDEGVLAGLEGATCPVCDAILGPEDAAGVRLHGCPACLGVFIDRASLVRATGDPDVRARLHGRASSGGPYRGAALHAAEPETGPRERFYRRCPACRTVMSRVNFLRRSAVFVDVCPRHGTWFDAAELARALDFAERGGLEEARRLEEAEREGARERERKERTLQRVTLASMPEGGSGREVNDLVDFLQRLFGLRG